VESEHRVLLTDGGVYDNLGLQVLEPRRDTSVSLHSFACEYLIACSAGHGQEAGITIPSGFYRRVQRAFGIVHRKAQDSTMHRLHEMKEARLIRGFVLPYLGQIDERLPWEPGVLTPRAEVIGYPTNFRAMSQRGSSDCQTGGTADPMPHCPSIAPNCSDAVHIHSAQARANFLNELPP
jgi:NTE family protein